MEAPNKQEAFFRFSLDDMADEVKWESLLYSLEDGDTLTIDEVEETS